MHREITITFVYAGQLANAANRSEEPARAKAGTPLVDLLREAARKHGSAYEELLFDETGNLRRALIVSFDGVQVAEPESCRLERDHEVFVMTPIAGG